MTSCISKFCEMVKYWDVTIKHEFFIGLSKNLEAGKSSISAIKVFKTLIKDQKDRMTYSYTTTSPAKQGEDGEAVAEEFTLNTSLTKLIKEVGLPRILLANFSDYQKQLRGKLAESRASTSDRKKIFEVNPKYSHHDEVNERL